MADGRFYLTTPIYYVNADPHLGHAYTTIMADVIARHHRQLGEDVFFLTGTDEHGAQDRRLGRGARGARRASTPTSCRPRFRDLGGVLNATYDFFIRTTDPEHEAEVQRILQALHDSGDVYKGSYGGWYCYGLEAFYAESDLLEGNALPGPQDAGRVGGGGELVLPHVGLPRPPAGALRRATRAGSSRRPATTRRAS